MAATRADRVLLAGDEYYATLAGVRALRAGGYEPWFAFWRGGTLAERSRATAGTIAVPDPAAGEDEYVRALAEAAERLSARAVLAGTEASIRALAGRDADFPGRALGACAPEAVERAADKLVLAELARKAGLSVPPTAAAGDGSAGVSFPAVLKPAQSTIRLDGAAVPLADPIRVETKAELDAELARRPDGHWLLQPFLTGQLTAVGGVAWKGELVSAVHQVSHRIYPRDCGVSAYAETVPRDRGLESRIGALLGLVGWSGIFEVQFVSSGGTSYLIDLNPRLYGSIGLAIAAGHNLPAVWADLLLGREPRVGEYEVGVRFRAEPREVRLVATLLAERRFGEALSALVPRPRTAHAVISLRDPKPALGLLRKVLPTGT